MKIEKLIDMLENMKNKNIINISVNGCHSPVCDNGYVHITNICIVEEAEFNKKEG